MPRLARRIVFWVVPLTLLAMLSSGSGRVLAFDPEGADREWTAGQVQPIQSTYGRLGTGYAGLLQDDPAPEPQLFDDTLLREIDIRFEQSDWLGALGCSGGPGGFPGQPGGEPVPDEDIPVTVVVDGERLEQVGARCKGNSSLGIQGNKKPLNLDLDAFVAGQELWGHDTINLNNGYADPTLLREAIGYRMFRDYMPVPRFGFARVTVNGQYLGMYVTAEQLSGEWVDHLFPDDRGTVIKGDSPTRIALNSSQLTWAGESLESYKSRYQVKGRNAGSDEGYVALREMIRALDAPTAQGGLSDADFADGIWKALDVDLALWYLAGNNLITNFDSYYAGHNYYMYLGQRDPRFSMVSWDLNLGFGIFRIIGGGQGGPGGQPPGGNNPPVAESDPFAQESDPFRPLIRRLLAVPEYRADYIAHYRTLLDAVWTRDWVSEVGGSYQDLIRQAAREEAVAQGGIAGSFSPEQFEQNFLGDIEIAGRRGTTIRPGILSLVEARGAFLRARPDFALPDLQLSEQGYAPAAPTAADEPRILARFEGADLPETVELRYRVRGGMEERVAMARGEDGAWTATLPAQRAGRTVSYGFRAGLADGRASFFPEANWSHPYAFDIAGVDLPMAAPGDLVVNELMADNLSTLADEAGEFDDWVELYNRGTGPLSLAGLYLSDDPRDPWSYALPAMELGPGERLLIWADNEPDQGPLHAPFRLDRKGEAVSLASREAILDWVEHGELETDLSWARLPDGGDAWQICHSPTPGGANRCSAAPPDPPTREGAIYLPWLTQSR